MPSFLSSGTKTADSAPKDQWIPYRENGEVKYMRAGSDEARDFTATGATAKISNPSAWGNLVAGGGAAGGFGIQAPQLLYERYTDDTVIPVIVTNFVLPEKPVMKEKKSFMDKFKRDKESSTTMTVWMPRREYKKYFARDNDGAYAGTEPQREWTEEDLEEEFGMYHKEF